jgi:hypothetical protein
MNIRLGFAAALVLSPLLAIGCSDLGEPLRFAPQPGVSVAALDFGTVAVGGSATRSVSVFNSGTADFTGTAHVWCDGFKLDEGAGEFTVPPGGEHDVVVRFEPNTIGSFRCELRLGDGLAPVPLNGQASDQLPGSQCLVTAARLEFGSVNVGASRVLTFTVKNPGTAPTTLDVVSDRSAFVILSGGGPSTLVPDDTLLVSVSFQPTAIGPDSCLIATGPGCPTVRGRGTATSPAVSFSAQILPILSSRGCNSGCHARFWNQASDLVNVTTVGYAPAKLIKPSDLAGSVLFGKVTNSGQYGQSMPQGSPLIPLAERNLIRDWILQGALDN